MKMRTATLMILALVVIIAAIAAITVTSGRLPADRSAPGTEAASSAPDSTERPSPSSAPQEPQPTESSAPNPDAGGQEQNPSNDGTGPLGPRPDARVAPLISAPVPTTASALGKLVAGFPSAVISQAPESTVMFSSVASEGDRVQVGLVGMSTRAPSDVLAHYNTTLAKLGLVGGSVPAVDNSTATAFTRGPNVVTVTVTSVGGGSRYTVFGVLLAGS